MNALGGTSPTHPCPGCGLHISYLVVTCAGCVKAYEAGRAAEQAEVIEWLEGAPGIGNPDSIYQSADEIAEDIRQGCHIRRIAVDLVWSE